jgi:hypothetical protein
VFGPDTTLAELREWLEAEARTKPGAICPACTRKVRVYKRTIHASMANSLITMWWLGNRGSLDWFDYATRGDEAKLRYWDLIEDDPDRDSRWRVTPVGQAFILGDVRMEKYADVFNTRCLARYGEMISIRDALASGGFDYEELMRNPGTASPGLA